MRGHRVFIVGAGVVCALGNDLPAFFAGLRSGVSGLKTLRRIDTSRLATRIGGEVDLSLLESPPLVSGRIWDPRLDTKAFLAWNALKQLPLPEAAGIPVFCSVGLERVAIASLLSPAKGEPICPEFPPALLPGLLARALGRPSPVFIQASACAAGTIAIGSAFRSIRSGMFSAAIAGGVDSMLSEYGIHAFNSLGALAELNEMGARALAPFDRNRSGTLLGEGAAFVLLMSEAAMRTAGRSPLAEIIGFGGSTDGFHQVMPCPDGWGAVLAMKNALADAELSPGAVDYINAHGTGTLHNDKAEAGAIRTLFGEQGGKIPVSSIKPFIGHLLSAAGAIETLACLLPLTEGVIPPTLHFQTPDPDCPIDCVPNHSRAGWPEVVMKNSYGFGGQNASLILKRPS